MKINEWRNEIKRNINKNQNKVIAVLAITLCLMAVGYVALTQQLKINDTAKITGE